jgi:Spy/CpxP family protein refolding chaperone
MSTHSQIRRFLATCTLALALAPAAAWSQPYGMHMGWDDGAMMQPGMMGGMGMMGGCPMMPGTMGHGPGMMGHGMGMMGHGMGMMGPGRMMYGLDLTAEQRTEMRRIRQEMRRQHWETMGRLMEAHEELQELLAADAPDPAAVGQAHARIAELKRPMIEARIEAMNEMRALLTDEQREQMRKGPRGMGMMPGMQDGMGPGMRR